MYCQLLAYLVSSSSDTRGMAAWCRGIKIAIDLKNSTPEDGKLRAFHRHLKANADRSDIQKLREEVEAFATDFPMPGL